MREEKSQKPFGLRYRTIGPCFWVKRVLKGVLETKDIKLTMRRAHACGQFGEKTAKRSGHSSYLSDIKWICV